MKEDDLANAKKMNEHQKWSVVNIKRVEVVSTLFFFLKKSDERKSGDKNKKKNGAHTHVCTTVQLSERNIHVGCCLFSHKNECKQNKKNKEMFMFATLFMFCLRSVNYFKEKKTEHTRMYAQLCSSRAQYSRRLLSILAHPKTKNKQNITNGLLAAQIFCLLS